MKYMLHCLIIFAILIVATLGEKDENIENGLKGEFTAFSQGADASTTVATSSDIKKLTINRCAREYNMNCLKVDLIATVEKLGRNTDIQLLPGMRIVADPKLFNSQQRSEDFKIVFSAGNISNKLDELLIRRLVNYAKSISLNVRIFDRHHKRNRSLFDFNSWPILWKTPTEGRADKKQGKWNGSLTTAAVFTGGVLLWMGLSSLMGMAMKALAASLLSIIISLFTAYKSSGGSHKSTTYEIVAKPVYSHGYAPELQHADPHAAAATATGHQYGRNIEWDKMASMSSSRSEVQVPIREDAHQLLAYRTHVRPIFKRSPV